MAGGPAPPPEAMRKGMSGKVAAFVVVVVAIVAFVAGLGLGAVISAPPRLVLTLVNAHNLPFPPFEDYDDALGTIVGFNVDIAQEIANATGRKLVLRNFVDFDVLLATVATGGVDMAVASITMSGSKGAARNATLDFSDSYWRAGPGALVAPGNFDFTCANQGDCTPAEIAGSPDHVIGVQLATTSEQWVDDNVAPLMTNPGQNIKRFGNVATVIAGLRAGSLQIVIIDEPVARAYARPAASGFKMGRPLSTGELYGIAVDDHAPQGLVPIINEVLRQLRASGKYDLLVQTWFA